MLPVFCFWVYIFETSCGALIHHVAALVQRTLQNSTKIFWDTTLVEVLFF